MEARRADVHFPGFNPLLGQQLLERLEDRRFAGGFLRALGAERLGSVSFQAQPTRFINLKLSEFETPCPKVHRQK